MNLSGMQKLPVSRLTKSPPNQAESNRIKPNQTEPPKPKLVFD
jgi:hypothetical protein